MASDVSVLVLLDTIVEAGDRLAILVSESSADSVEADWRTYDAICLGLIRMGEAGKALPDPVKDEASDIPWAEIVALRNRIAHGYESLLKRRIWEIATLDAPVLAEAARRLRTRLEDRD